MCLLNSVGITVPTTTVMPTGGGGSECFYEGSIMSYFNYTFRGQLNQYEGEFEVCIGGLYGSVCDIGWDQAAAEAVCRDQFGSRYGE